MPDRVWPVVVEDDPHRASRSELLAVVVGSHDDARRWAGRWNEENPEAVARGARAGADYAVPLVTEVPR